jgi:hypothetical protein
LSRTVRRRAAQVPKGLALDDVVDREHLRLAREFDPTSVNTGLSVLPNASNCSRESQISLSRRLSLKVAVPEAIIPPFVMSATFVTRWRGARAELAFGKHRCSIETR